MDGGGEGVMKAGSVLNSARNCAKGLMRLCWNLAAASEAVREKYAKAFGPAMGRMTPRLFLGVAAETLPQSAIHAYPSSSSRQPTHAAKLHMLFVSLPAIEIPAAN